MLLVDNWTNHWTERLHRWRCSSLVGFMRIRLISLGPNRRHSFWPWTRCMAAPGRKTWAAFFRWVTKSGRRNCVPHCAPRPFFSNTHT
jgi:hypothetical protein